MKYSLAIFDLDGTILDTLEDLANSVNYALAEYGYPLHTIEEVRTFVGNGIRNLMERSVPEGTPTESIDLVHKTFMAHYKEHCADCTRPYDGIEELLRKLRTEKILTAVVSNKADPAVNFLCQQYFPGLLDSSAGEQPGIAKKPSPGLINILLERFDIAREHAVYIGDSEVDIATAKNASMDCILVDWGFRPRKYLIEQGGTCIVSSMEELTALLLQ